MASTTPPPTGAAAPASVDFGPFTAHFATQRAQGNRPEQQDETLILAPLDLAPVLPGRPKTLARVTPLALFAVMDGHGSDGGKASRSVRDALAREAPVHFAAAVAEHVPEDGDAEDVAAVERAIRQALAATVLAVHGDLTTDAGVDCYLSGTTLVLAALTARSVHVANLGDSRAVLGRVRPDGSVEAKPLSNDHTCSNKEELDRVLKKGARVERSATEGAGDDGPLRLFKGSMPYPGLVVTRALGDTASTAIGVLSTPELTDHALDVSGGGGDTMLILASDGVWDGLPGPTEAIGVVQRVLAKAPANGGVSGRVAEVASKKLIKAALAGLDKRQIDDNVSNVCVLLTKNEGAQ
ncbi:hypothetical protein H9P43_002111 [Blastocladiella emersonii ATCC 22665]|nr:hypothetical protein H9P43_002111 [Blastocladiella emersonii ATCC 22665]